MIYIVIPFLKERNYFFEGKCYEDKLKFISHIKTSKIIGYTKSLGDSLGGCPKIIALIKTPKVIKIRERGYNS